MFRGGTQSGEAFLRRTSAVTGDSCLDTCYRTNSGDRMSKPVVSIVMGSDSDLEIMREVGKALEGFGIAYEIDVTSAHRSPDRTAAYARAAAERGIHVIVAGAGGAAQHAGVIAAHTTLPVIGVPIPSTS